MGDFIKDFKLLIPGYMDLHMLQPMYKKIYDVYQKYDTSKIMFYEPPQGPDTVPLFGGLVFPVGFSENPGGNENTHNQMLNDHTYCCQVSATMCANKEPPLDQEETCRKFNRNRVMVRDRDAARFGVPLIISEFGACTSSQNCMNEINSVVDACDEYLTSWAYWQFKTYMDITTSAGDTSEGFYEKNGTLQRNKAEALSRSYVKAAQGVTKKMFFDRITYQFDADFVYSSKVQKPTTVFINKDYFYTQGYDLKLSIAGNEISSYEVQELIPNHLDINILDKSLDGELIEIRIVPAFSKLQYE